MRSKVTLEAIICGVTLVVGCASAAAPPTSTAAAPPARDSQPRVAEVAAPAAAAAEAKPAEPATEDRKPADEPRDGLRKASRPPLDLLTGNNVVYMLNFKGSPKGEAVKAQCESEGEPSAVRACVEKERSKVAIESARFVKDAHGQFWWITYNRYKGNLLKWHKVQFVPGKEDADTISLTLVGKDKGIAPMARVPASLKVELPNDYSIVVTDPEYGELLYDAKIGLMDPQAE